MDFYRIQPKKEIKSLPAKRDSSYNDKRPAKTPHYWDNYVEIPSTSEIIQCAPRNKKNRNGKKEDRKKRKWKEGKGKSGWKYGKKIGADRKQPTFGSNIDTDYSIDIENAENIEDTQEIDKFNTRIPSPEYENLNALMKDFDEIEYSNGPKVRKEMFRLLHAIDLEVYKALNQGMNKGTITFLKEIDEYLTLQRILKISGANYTELIGRLIEVPGYDGTEIPIALPDNIKKKDENIIRDIWKRLFTRQEISEDDSKKESQEGPKYESQKEPKIQIVTNADKESDGFKKTIYSYIGKTLHYETGVKLLSAALSGEHIIEISPTDDGPKAEAINKQQSSFRLPENPDEVEAEYYYQNPWEFEDDFFELLDKIKENAKPFSIGNRKFERAVGTDAMINMPRNPKPNYSYTGTKNKETQFEPWLVFAHELGHAVKFAYGMDFLGEIPYDKDTVKEFSENAEYEEYANNHLVENPLRKESGMRSRIAYEGLELVMANKFRERLKPNGDLGEFFNSLVKLQEDAVLREKDDVKELFSILKTPNSLAKKIMENKDALVKLEADLRNLPYLDKTSGKILVAQLAGENEAASNTSATEDEDYLGLCCPKCILI